MNLWQKILEIRMEEWAPIPEDIVELKPMELNNGPKSCDMGISPEI